MADQTPSSQPKLPKSDPRKEYVSGGRYSWLNSSFFQTLPPYIDDITADFGDDIYERMLLDYQVSSSLNLLKLAILAQGLTTIPAIKDKEDPNFAKSQEIAEFCRRNLKRLKKPGIMQLCWQLLDGMAYGHKLAEQTYELVKTGPDKGKLCLKSIKAKPRRVTAFVTDAFLNVVGILALLPSQPASTILQGLLAIKPNNPANLLPTDRFVIFSFRSKDNDPRGTSLLRAAYDPWWHKKQVEQEYLKYLGQFAGPSLVGKLPENANPVPIYDQNNEIISYIEPSQAMLDSLMEFRNASVTVLPSGAELDTIKVEGDGEAFIKAIERDDRAITVAILLQSLATGEGQHNARAASQTHQDVMGLVIQNGKDTLSECVVNDIFYPLVLMNYGEEAAATLLPEVSLSQTEDQDFSTNLIAVATAWKSGYLHGSQQPGLDAKLGLPERDLEAIAREEDEALLMAEQARQDALQQPQPADATDDLPPAPEEEDGEGNNTNDEPGTTTSGNKGDATNNRRNGTSGRPASGKPDSRPPEGKQPPGKAGKAK